MIAAIYARKSTDQVGVSDKERSVTRQATTPLAVGLLEFISHYESENEDESTT